MNATTFIRIVVPACLYAVAGLLLVSFANERFQLWFDTGYTLTSFERFAYCAAFILSFPIATWGVLLHPARINKAILFVALLLNGALWSWIILAATKRRRARSAGPIQSGAGRSHLPH